VQRGVRRPGLKVDPGSHLLSLGEGRKAAALGRHHHDESRLAVPDRDDLRVLEPTPVSGLAPALRMEQAVLDGRPWRSVPLAERDYLRIDLLQVGVIEVGAELRAHPKGFD